MSKQKGLRLKNVGCILLISIGLAYLKPVKALQQNIFTDSSKAALLLWIIYVISVLFVL